MSDEIEEYFSKKLGKNDKRGGVRNSQDLHNDQRLLDMSATRTPAQLQHAQLQLAALALEHPDLMWSDEREAWLTEVLEALGLRRTIHGLRPQDALPCAPFTGTMRGYNIHLRGYTAPCTKCKNVSVEAENQRLRELGIETEDEKWTLTRS